MDFLFGVMAIQYIIWYPVVGLLIFFVFLKIIILGVKALETD